MRRLVLVLVLLVGLLAVADRVAALAAERVVGERIQQEASLGSRPDVTIGGIPFLTQAVRGRYDDVTVNIRGLRRGDLVISDIRAHMSGVHLPLSDVVRQHASGVRIDHATAEVDLDYSDLNAFIRQKGLRLSAGAHGQVHVNEVGPIANASAPPTGGDIPVTVQGDSLLLAVGSGTTVSIPLPQLPFGIRLQTAHATPDGIVVVCSATGLVIRR